MAVNARKLVVISCGACGTPSVLERSGIGNPVILAKAKVPLVVDLPGVGHDYQDHNLISYTYRTGLTPDQTLDTILRGPVGSELPVIDMEDDKLRWNGVWLR